MITLLSSTYEVIIVYLRLFLAYLTLNWENIRTNISYDVTWTYIKFRWAFFCATGLWGFGELRQQTNQTEGNGQQPSRGYQIYLRRLQNLGQNQTARPIETPDINRGPVNQNSDSPPEQDIQSSSVPRGPSTRNSTIRHKPRRRTISNSTDPRRPDMKKSSTMVPIRTQPITCSTQRRPVTLNYRGNPRPGEVRYLGLFIYESWNDRRWTPTERDYEGDDEAGKLD